MLGGRLERRVHLAVVVAAALQVPDLLVGEVLHELERPRVAAEEVLAHVGARLGLVGLVVAVGRDVHEVAQRAVVVAREQVVPLAAPDDLDDVPSGAAEEALELLDDLAVAAHRAVEALEVAVDDEREVVEALVRGHLQLAAALDLVHLAVAEERPHLLVGRVLDAAVGEVPVGLRLVDRVDRAEAHRDRRELPELGHEPRVRVRRQAVGRVRLLLAEAVELVGAEAALEEGAGVRAGGGVALDEDLVAAAGVVLAAEEVVEADLVEGGRRRVRRDVAADRDARALRAVHEHGRVPADPRAVAALDLLVTGELGLVLGRDRVEVVGRGDHRHAEVQLLRALQQAEHDLAAALVPLLGDESVEGFGPFGCLVGIGVHRLDRVGVLVVDSHTRPLSSAGPACGCGACARRRDRITVAWHHAILVILCLTRRG